MNDPMSDRNERSALAFDPIDDFAEQTRAGVLKVRVASFEQKSPGGVLYGEPRVGFVLVQESLAGQSRIAPVRCFEQREFYTR